MTREILTKPVVGSRLVHVQTDILDIACEISGPPDGTPTVMVHGWPDSARTWDRLLPIMHAAGYQTFVPHLRGFGETRFRFEATPRRASLSTLGYDLWGLIDGLGLNHPHVIGHDWGARAAYVASCLWPERIGSCVALSVGWGTNNPGQVISFNQARNYWYHWYMALPMGEQILRNDHLGFVRYLWEIWNPGWTISDLEFAETAKFFSNPDWMEVVLHSYRVRWGLAEADEAAKKLDEQIASDPVIHVPTLVIHGGADPCNDPATSEGKNHLFSARYERLVLDNLGHFPQRQAPNQLLACIIPFLSKD